MSNTAYSDEILRQYAEGNLEDEENEQIEAYLLTHPKREAFVRQVERALVQEQLAAAGSSESIDEMLARAREKFDQEVAGTSNQEQARVRTLPRVYLIAAAIAALILVGIGWLVFRPAPGTQLKQLVDHDDHLPANLMSGDEQLDQIEQWLKAEQFAKVRETLAPLTSSVDTSQARLSKALSRRFYALGLSYCYGEPADQSKSLPWFELVMRKGQGPQLRRYAGLHAAMVQYERNPAKARQTLAHLLATESFSPEMESKIRSIMQGIE